MKTRIKQKPSKKHNTAISVTGIPRELKEDFDIAIDVMGHSLKDAIIFLMTEYVEKNKGSIDILKRERMKGLKK